MAPVVLGNSLYSYVSGNYGGSDRRASAAEEALSLGGYLATISSWAENAFLAGHFTGGWIGLSLNQGQTYSLNEPIYSSPDQWHWDVLDSSISAGEPTDYRAWAPPSGYLDPNQGPGYFAKPYVYFDAPYGFEPALFSGFWKTAFGFDGPTTGIAEFPLSLSITYSAEPKEGNGVFSTSINLSAGNHTSANLAEGTQVWWKITGITQDDLATGFLTGAGTITGGKLDLQHSLVSDADAGENFEVSVFSDAEMTQQIGATSIAPIKESGLSINLQVFNAGLPGAIGIDYSPSSKNLLLTANYPSGHPYNLFMLSGDQIAVPYSSISGFTEELKIATVKSSAGGFTAGETFLGNGNDGEIVKLSSDGKIVENPWVQLPGDGNGLLRGSLFHDSTGLFGGDLIAVTTSGQVWRVSSTKTCTLLASLGTHLEGLNIVPNDPQRYGPLAGKIIAGAEQQGRVYSISNTGQVDFYSLDVNVEDIEIIKPGDAFYGIDYAGSRLLTAPYDSFTGLEGEIVVAQETIGYSTSGLYRLYWDGTALRSEPFNLTAGSQYPGQWEHIAFAPSTLGVTIPTQGGGGPGGGIPPAQGFDFSKDNTLIISGPGSGTLDLTPFSNTNTLSLSIGSDNAYLEVSAGTNTQMTVHGGDGTDTFYGNENNNVLILTGINEGILDGVTFTGFENIDLKSGDDVVYIRPGGQLTGTLNGGTRSRVVVLPPGQDPPTTPPPPISGLPTPPPITPPINPIPLPPPPPGFVLDGGYNSIYLNDNSNTLTLSGLGSGVVDGTTFVNFYTIDLRGGSDNATIQDGGSLPGLLDGGDGTDQLTLNSAANTLTINQALVGSAAGTSIQGFESIDLADGNDSAEVTVDDLITGLSATRKSLSLDGGAGTDALVLKITPQEVASLKAQGLFQTLKNYLLNPTGQTLSIALSSIDLTLTGFETGKFFNNAPTNISCSRDLIPENLPTTDAVASLSTTDQDPSDTFTYELVAGAGDADNAEFTIVGNNLFLKASPDYESKSSYAIRLRTTDSGGLSCDKGFVINVGNLQEGDGIANPISSAAGALFQEGVTLAAGTITGDPDGNGTITGYQWYKDNTALTGATNSTYAVSATGVGAYKVAVTYTDGQGYSTTVSSPDQAVAKIDNGQGSLSAITGNGAFQEGVILTAGSVTGDPDGAAANPAYTYQWSLNNTAISGATNSTYAVSATGFGTYKVDVTYTDGQTYRKTVTSTSQAVNKINNGNAAITITGAATVGSTLTASIATADPDGNGTFSYQWRSSTNGSTWSNIAGATGSTCTLSANELNRQVQVIATYTDAQTFGPTTILSNLTSAITASTDTVAPKISEISLQGNTLVLTLSESIQPTGISINTFSVNVAGTQRSLTNASIDSLSPNKINLTLSGTAPSSTQTLTVSYPGTIGNQVKDLAGNPMATFTNVPTDTFITSGSISVLQAGYKNVILSGMGAINGVGNASANQITGNSASNTISGLAGGDTLTGLAGSDIFQYSSLSDSLLGTPSAYTFDRITDLAIGSDKIDGPSVVTYTQMKRLGAVATLDQTGIAALLTPTNFVANGASTFTFAGNRTFVALNDGFLGFDSKTDSVIEITGFTGVLSSLSII